MTLTKQLPTNLHDQKQLSRNITSFKNPLPATRSAGFGVSPAAVAASAWQRSHTHTSGCDTSEGTSELVPWGGTSMRHWNCSSAERARGRATYGTWREPSRLCRGCCRPARRKALPRSRLPEPPASFASWLAVLQRLAAERCRQSLRGVLEGRWAVLRHDRKPSPSYFLFSPLTRSGLQSGGAGSCRAVAAFVFPPRGSCLLLLRTNARGKNSNREGKGGGSRGGDTYPALSLSGKKKRKKITRGRGGKPEERRTQKEHGARRRRRCWGRHCGRALPRPLGSVTRRGFQSPTSSHGATVFARSGARSRAGGGAGARTASARRGAGQHLPGGAARAAAAAAGGLETPPPAAPAKPGGGRGGGKTLPPLPPLQAPPWLLLRRRLLLLTLPLWLSQTFRPALASLGNGREEEPRGPGPSAGARAEEGGARLSPGGRRCWSWEFAVWSWNPAPTLTAPHPAAGNRTPSLGCLLLLSLLPFR